MSEDFYKKLQQKVNKSKEELRLLNQIQGERKAFARETYSPGSNPTANDMGLIPEALAIGAAAYGYGKLKNSQGETVSNVNPNKNDPMLKMYLERDAAALDQRIENAQAELSKNLRMIDDMKAKMGGNLVQNSSAIDLKANLDNALPPHLRPGNLGSLYKVIWPYWFTGSAPVMPPNSSGQSMISVTQEAAFILVSYTRAVYQTNRDGFSMVDPNAYDQNGIVTGLNYTIRDASSSRMFMDRPVNINHAGWYNQPTVLPTPCLFLPNAQIEINYTNENPDTTYVPFITFFGYRLRIQDAQNMLGAVIG